MDESIEDLGGGMTIIQKVSGFRFGMDAVLLAHFTKVKSRDHIIDLGTGTGIIPILLAGLYRDISVIGVDIQEEYCDMAHRSVALNNMENTIDIKCMDLKKAPADLGYEIYDLVVSNPPYRKVNAGEISKYDDKAIARHEVMCNLEDVVKSASRLLKYGGRFSMVHLPERFAEIVSTLRQYNLEIKRTRLVYPDTRSDANLILLECIKGGNPGMTVSPPLIVSNADKTYTDEIIKIYRGINVL